MQFNFIAKYYDIIAKIVFGSTLELAKTSLFSKISKQSNVLIIGGGTGTSLKKLVSLKPQAHIGFVEISEQMILRAKQKVSAESLVKFFHSSIEEFDKGGYDVIITEFFFDLFEQEEGGILVSLIALKLNPKGCWIDTDFRKTDKIYHNLILKAMYPFFKITAQIKARKLAEINQLVNANRFTMMSEKKFKSGFISSRLFVRS